jgi:hypothetical protein
LAAGPLRNGATVLLGDVAFAEGAVGGTAQQLELDSATPSRASESLALCDATGDASMSG